MAVHDNSPKRPVHRGLTECLQLTGFYGGLASDEGGLSVILTLVSGDVAIPVTLAPDEALAIAKTLTNLAMADYDELVRNANRGNN